MLAQFKAMAAAVHTAASTTDRRSFAVPVGLVFAAALCGCQQTVPLAGLHPADPGARVQTTGYRPTTAPYRSMRPAAPAAWSDRDGDTAAPAPERPRP